MARARRAPFEDAVLSLLDAELERIAAACGARGKIAGVHSADGGQAAQRIAQGFAFVTAATDVSSLRADMPRQLGAGTGAEPAAGAARAY